MRRLLFSLALVMALSTLVRSDCETPLWGARCGIGNLCAASDPATGCNNIQGSCQTCFAGRGGFGEIATQPGAPGPIVTELVGRVSGKVPEDLRKAGIREGDLIVSVNGRGIESGADLMALKTGDVVVIQRGGRTNNPKRMTVTLK
jgi:hypothetical protein